MNIDQIIDFATATSSPEQTAIDPAALTAPKPHRPGMAVAAT